LKNEGMKKKHGRQNFFLGRGDNNAHRHKVTVGTVDFQRVCAKKAKMYTHVKMYTHQHLLFLTHLPTLKVVMGWGKEKEKGTDESTNLWIEQELIPWKIAHLEIFPQFLAAIGQFCYLVELLKKY
jgi:hypothetical protein